MKNSEADRAFEPGAGPWSMTVTDFCSLLGLALLLVFALAGGSTALDVDRLAKAACVAVERQLGFTDTRMAEPVTGQEFWPIRVVPGLV